MTELIGWILVVGLMIAIGAIYVLSIRIEKHMRETTQMMLHGYDAIMARLKRLSGARVEAPEPVVGVALERRCTHRRARVVPMTERAGKSERRTSLGRRREDLAAVG